MQSVNLLFVYVSIVVGMCVSLVLLLYNVVAGVLFLKETGDGNASGAARAAWGLGVLALMSSVLPCIGSGIALTALLMATFERRRIYADTSSLAGATPVRLARVDAWTALAIQLLLVLALAAGAIVGTPGATVPPEILDVP